MDSGCSNSTAFTAACSEGLCAEGLCITTGGRCEQTTSKLSVVKVKCAAVVTCGCVSHIQGGTDALKCCCFVFAGGEGHHDRGSFPRAGASPAQREGGALGSRLTIHARQHHRSLSDLLSWCS